MRVLMITTDHLMIDRRILQEAQTLARAGYGVEIFAGFECNEAATYDLGGIGISRFRFDWTDARLDRFFAFLGLRPGRLRTALWAVARRAVAAFTGFSSFEHFVLRHVMECDYDILHCHDFPLLAVAVEAKRRRGKPLVYDAHELYHAQVQLPAATRRRYKSREARLIRHADLAITVNPFLARIMADDYGCRLPSVILNAAPLRRENDPRSDLRGKLGFGDQDRIVLYQGWMSPERGLDCLIRTARYFPANVHLVMIGYGLNETELRALSTEQGTDDGRVVFLGRVEADELACLTAVADLGVIPYHAIDLNNRYCSPNKLFEFLAAGVPFVCNELPFLRTIIDAYGCGMVTDLSKPEAAAAAILSIMGHPIGLKALKDAAESAGRELSWEKEGEKLVALYELKVVARLVRAAPGATAGDAADSAPAP
jgi:glycosyltransferase involved in cell wall biosynthesis